MAHRKSKRYGSHMTRSGRRRCSIHVGSTRYPSTKAGRKRAVKRARKLSAARGKPVTLIDSCLGRKLKFKAGHRVR